MTIPDANEIGMRANGGSRTARTTQEEIASAYAEHLPAMLRAAHAILRNETDAEDLVHDTFIEACEKWAHYDSARGSLRSWLLVRLRSRAIDRLRRVGRTQIERELPAEAETRDPFRSVQADRAWKLLATMPERMRDVLVLRFGEDLPVAEVAARSGIPAGTVKSRQSHAVQWLRAELDRSP